MIIDLHNHTKYSDGVDTPLELFNSAKRNNVDIFALTDHDSVFGCQELLELDGKDNIRVILGMELSTDYKRKSVHIVCLFKNNIIPEEIKQFSIDMLNKRKDRAIIMMNKIHDIYGLKVDIPKLIEQSDIITRANMLRNIAECNNLSLEEASFFVSNKSAAYIPSTKLSAKDGIAFAKKCGCVTILAHPCLLPKDIVDEVISFGVEGIEVKYPSNGPNDEEYFRNLAKKHNLLISAGSDCHGDSTHAPIGTSTLTKDEFMPLAERIGFNYGN